MNSVGSSQIVLGYLLPSPLTTVKAIFKSDLGSRKYFDLSFKFRTRSKDKYESKVNLLSESDEVFVVGVHVRELAVDKHEDLVFASLLENRITTLLTIHICWLNLPQLFGIFRESF